jgi:hypothetical protein
MPALLSQRTLVCHQWTLLHLPPHWRLLQTRLSRPRPLLGHPRILHLKRRRRRRQLLLGTLRQPLQHLQGKAGILSQAHVGV